MFQSNSVTGVKKERGWITITEVQKSSSDDDVSTASSYSSNLSEDAEDENFADISSDNGDKNENKRFKWKNKQKTPFLADDNFYSVLHSYRRH